MLFLVLLILPLVHAGGAADEPEAKMKTMELVQHYGYLGEAVDVTTEDGYILEMHHIPYGKNGPPSNPCRPAVLVVHGLMAESSSFLKIPANECLPLILADAGYDVWLGNVRGNTYGRRHTYLTTKDKAFWDYSWDDMSRMDLVAMVDKVLNESGQKTLYYVGHSQIRAHFELAPIGSLANLKGVTGLAARVLEGVLKPVFRAYSSRALLPDRDWLTAPKRALCRRGAGLQLCGEFLLLVGGPRSDQINASRIPIFIEGSPAGSSAKNVQHMSQLVLGDGKVRRFDYGSRWKNLDVYGVEKVPEYDYSKIITPTYLYWADEDYFATPEDMEQGILAWMDPQVIVENNHLKGYSHFDFIVGSRAPVEIYHPIKEVIQKDFDWNCSD